MPKSTKSKAKEFSPKMNLLLFEEPEAFLHPPQQQHLCRDLMSLSNSDSWQVILTTHSSHFVSRSSEILTSIVHLVRTNGISKIFQISKKEWEEIVDRNRMIHEISSRYPDVCKEDAR